MMYLRKSPSPQSCPAQGLLSLAMLVAEAMQRSSRKQFTQHAGPCSVWLSSCEVHVTSHALSQLTSYHVNRFDHDMATTGLLTTRDDL